MSVTEKQEAVSEETKQAVSIGDFHLHSILEGYPGVLALFDQDEKIVWANNNIEMFSSNVIGKEFQKVFCWNNSSCPARAVLQSALDGKRDSVVQQVLSKSQNEMFIEFVGTPVESQSGSHKSAIMFCSDVTDKYKLEKQLRHAQKMEAIGTLAGGIAHDFNNVLTPIMGYSEIVKLKMKKTGQVDEELDDYLSEILRAARRAKGLVEQILTFSRSSEQKESMQYIHPIVKEVMKLMRVTLPSSIKIVENIDDQCGMVVVDPVLIHQVLINLCTNSSHAMGGDQGVIKVTLAKVEEEFEDKKWIELSVEDTGCGIEPKMIDRIFEPYFTTKEKEQGTGMGLAMVHGIIKRQGGRVEVESKIGEGTIFRTFLAVANDVSTTLDQVVSSDELIAGDGKVLLVDDDAQVVQVTGELLTNLGYEVKGVTSPLEALSIVDKEEFDLVITDLTMPEINGVDLAEKIKQIQPKIPIILFSGYSEQFSKNTAYEAGIDAYCIKPVSLREISRVIRQVMSRSVLSNQS